MGKTLGYARMEIKQLKGYLVEKKKRFEDYKTVPVTEKQHGK